MGEKLKVAGQLAALGVDIIEAGFPAASPGDLDAVQRIAGEVGTEDGPIIAGLARATPGDIDRAWEGVKGAKGSLPNGSAASVVFSPSVVSVRKT